MRTAIAKRVVSYLLLLGGAFLLFEGARDFLISRWGQSTAESEFAELQTTTKSAGPQHFHLGDTVAKLEIPRLGAALYVVEGTDKHDLRLGPGHMVGTALPGADGNCVIAGHRDTHFRVLKDVRRGDDLILETGSQRFVYTVKDTAVVDPTNTHALQPTRGAVVNLITCYPFYYVGNAPKRFIVEAELVPPQSASLVSPAHSVK
ncbi:MAG: class D sortase [Acidobacteriia bacterium]|nr:class D sortase [Terriglobia bacterium]